MEKTMMNPERQTELEIQWYKLERAWVALKRELYDVDWAGLTAFAQLLEIYLEAAKRDIKEGRDPAETNQMPKCAELHRAGFILSRVWPLALMPRGEQREFFQGLLGDRVRVSLRDLLPKRTFAVGVVSAEAVTCTPGTPLTASAYLTPGRARRRTPSTRG